VSNGKKCWWVLVGLFGFLAAAGPGEAVGGWGLECDDGTIVWDCDGSPDKQADWDACVDMCPEAITAHVGPTSYHVPLISPNGADEITIIDRNETPLRIAVKLFDAEGTLVGLAVDDEGIVTCCGPGSRTTISFRDMGAIKQAASVRIEMLEVGRPYLQDGLSGTLYRPFRLPRVFHTLWKPGARDDSGPLFHDEIDPDSRVDNIGRILSFMRIQPSP
jgi:hypothetical protein